MAKRDDREPRQLLARILDIPDLAPVVPRLHPELLHRVIQRCGLEDCGALVAMATPAQLAAVFDLDLWRCERPGSDEQLDAERFGAWLEVLADAGAASAARTLAAIDADVITAALAQYIRVFDPGVLAPASDEGGEAALLEPDLGLKCEIGGYAVFARRGNSWDAIVDILNALDAEHADYFHRLMAGCRRVSNAGREIDGLDELLPDADQLLFDCAVAREQRRERQGYENPAEAAAFLQMSRALPLGPNSSPPRSNPIATAYLRAVAESSELDAPRGSGLLLTAGAPEESASAATILDIVEMIAADFAAERPRALLGEADGQPSPLAHVNGYLDVVHERDVAAYSRRNQELGYLANALVSGCSIQGRSFTQQEASDAAYAVCNLGLENWPTHWLTPDDRRKLVGAIGAPLPDDFLVDRDLVSVFQVGWTVLHQNVCMYAAGELVRILSGLHCDDAETRAGLRALRLEMAKQRRAGTPWRARNALDAIAILDMPAWAGLLGLIDECPVLPAAITALRARTRSISPSDFEFIADNRQIGYVREFMQALPEALRS